MNGPRHTTQSSRFSHFGNLIDDTDTMVNSHVNGNDMAFTAGMLFASSGASNENHQGRIGSFVTAKITDTDRPRLAGKMVTSPTAYPAPLQYAVLNGVSMEKRVGQVTFTNAAGITALAKRPVKYVIPHPKNSLPIGAWDRFIQGPPATDTTSTD